MTSPELEQRRTALARANDVRVFRAQMKKAIKAGEVSVVDVIAHPPPQVDTMKVFDLLLAAPKVGRVKANKVTARCRISPSKTVAALSERQRGELVRLVSR